MSSTTPQPIPQVPPIESLAPPLPEVNPESKSAVAAPDAVSASPKDESWVPVEVHGTENGARTDTNSNGANPDSDVVKIADADSSPALINRVMKQRSSILPQTAHVQKDNTLAIFVTLCLVVVAIACGIYFVADRETQTETQTPDHIASASINQLPPPAESVQTPPAETVQAPVEPVQPIQSTAMTTQQAAKPEFGKPIAKSMTTKIAASSKPKLDKASSLIAQSQIKLSHMQYIEAEYSARQATELKPASADAWLALGRAFYSQGRYSEAKQAFKTCIKRDAQSKAARTADDFISNMPALGQTK